MLHRNRWISRNEQNVRTAQQDIVARLERIAFEREGLRAVHASVDGFLARVNAIALPLAAAAEAGQDWRDTNSGQELRAAAMHANVACAHRTALLLDQRVIQAVKRLLAAAYPMYWTRESGSKPEYKTEFFAAVEGDLRSYRGPPARVVRVLNALSQRVKQVERVRTAALAVDDRPPQSTAAKTCHTSALGVT
ncbi:hypothetical protein AB0H92_37980 [Streptomyces phaeochromogenes]|uniref:hypothetical protein n=1 Tax=Streptomyces phaeochromogenes TaxID=1923 RepID=UPI0033E4FEE2